MQKLLTQSLKRQKRLKREWEKLEQPVLSRASQSQRCLFSDDHIVFCYNVGFLDDTQFDDDPNEPALNVNGDMEVYPPDGSEVKNQKWLKRIGQPTKAVIYIESDKNNITDQRILQEISYVEKTVNPYVSDNESDDVIYILSMELY